MHGTPRDRKLSPTSALNHFSNEPISCVRVGISIRTTGMQDSRENSHYYDETSILPPREPSSLRSVLPPGFPPPNVLSARFPPPTRSTCSSGLLSALHEDDVFHASLRAVSEVSPTRLRSSVSKRKDISQAVKKSSRRFLFIFLGALGITCFLTVLLNYGLMRLSVDRAADQRRTLHSEITEKLNAIQRSIRTSSNGHSGGLNK